MDLKNFDIKIFNTHQNAGRLSLLQFWSSWCGCCHDTEHLRLFQLANKDIQVLRVNADEDEDFSSKYGVVVLPTYLLIENFKNIGCLAGIQSKASLEKILQNADRVCKSYFKI
jgi:thioredoxin 1